MDYTKYDKPEVGRGVAFGINEVGEPCAKEARGCFRLHEEPWLSEYPDNFPTDIFEVRFKNTRRSFYQNVNNLQLEVGDIVAVEASPGHDIGIISLTGDMVARQMKRIGFNPQNGEFKKIYRKARPYDIEKWQEAIALEHETMIRSRQIAADMGLDMKIGDVEYQGDKIKAIFYYIADGRVDFRELIKVFAEQFHIRIEMKQIGARQEAGRIGGIGACGRELCCASWMSSFSSVTTNAARMQEISLNPQKLAGQCSKLKCCLMYEYDVYADARRTIPRLREPLQTMDGEYYLIKVDPLAGTMSFSSSKNTISNFTTLSIARVKEILAINRAGEKADTLLGSADENVVVEPTFRSEEDSITRFDQKGGKRNRKNKRNRGERGAQSEAKANAESTEAPKSEASESEPQGNNEPREQREAREPRERRREQRRHNYHKGERGEQRGDNERRNSGNEERSAEHSAPQGAPQGGQQQDGQQSDGQQGEARRERRGRNNHRRGHRREGQHRGGEEHKANGGDGEK